MRTSHGALSPGELGAVVGNADAGEPFYRITVSLTTQAVMAYGKPEPLKPGMLVVGHEVVSSLIRFSYV